MALCFLLCNALVFVFLCDVANAQKNGGEFVVGYKDAPTSLNPLNAEGTISSTITQILFDGLITLTPSGKILPRLAEKWRVSEDGKVWTFFLRKDVKFHDGTPLTAKDAEFTYGFLLKGSSDISLKMMLQNVREVKAESDYILRVRLKKKERFFLAALYYIGVLPLGQFSGDPTGNREFDKAPLGSGSFKFASWSNDGEIMLEANDGYFSGRPHLDRLRFVKLTDTFEMWRKLQLGEIDAAYNDISPANFDYLKTSASLKTYQKPDLMIFALWFNFNNKIFQDVRMRKALSLAIDRREILQYALNGYGTEANGIFLPGSFSGSNENEYNPARSQQLFEEMGYEDADGDGILEKDGKPLIIEVLIDKGDNLKKEAFLVLQTQLLQLGVRLKEKETSVQAIYQKAMANNYDMLFINFLGALDAPVIFWRSKYRFGLGNLSHYGNPDVDALFDRLIVSDDVEERKQIMKEIHEITSEDAAGIFLFVRNRLLAINAKFAGVDPDADSFPWEFVTDLYISGEKE